VVDHSGVLYVINRSRPERELTRDADRQLEKFATSVEFPHLHSDHSLDLALERMGANQLDVLPVVNRANVHKLEGVVTLRDVLDSYGVN
jgi:chloride channel protein, CIC family